MVKTGVRWSVLSRLFWRFVAFLSIAVVASLSGTACIFERTVSKSYRAVYYVAKKRVQFKQKVKNAPPTEIKASSFKRLDSAQTTIAFLPPDICTKRTTQGYKSQRQADFLRTRCGVMMTHLQNRAIRMGFKVFSWKQMGSFSLLPKGPSSLAFARKQGIDYLFVVNEFGRNQNSFGSVVSNRLTFHKAHVPPSRLSVKGDDDDLEPLRVKRSVGLRCHRFMKGKLPNIKGRTTISLNLNMVDAKTGQVLWNYRREMGFSKKHSVDLAFAAAWKARDASFVAKSQRNVAAGLLGSFFWLGVGVGTPLLIGGLAGDITELSVLGGVTLVAGAGLGVATFIALTAGRNSRRVYNSLTIPNPKSPSEVFCQGDALPVGESRPSKASSRPSGRSRSSFSFTSATQASHDQDRAKIDTLMKKLMDDFFSRLKKR